MNLVDIFPALPVFTVSCSRCGRPARSDSGLQADLDGWPFTYYCQGCSDALRAAQSLLEEITP